MLGANFIGSSNTYMAYTHDLEAIGTNAHELPMAMAALANSDEEMRQSQYRLLELWQQTYQGELLIMLPDTFGTTQFLENAPDWVANWTGQRIDSKNPFLAGDEYIDVAGERGCDPRTKRLIASDGLDVDMIVVTSRLLSEAPFATTPTCRSFASAADFVDPEEMAAASTASASAPVGEHILTNDFRDCNPQGNDSFNPVSLVCKLSEVDGRPAVKLSDNYQKAMGPPAEIERYRRIFGTAGVANVPVNV